MNTKVCRTCGETKNISGFHRDKYYKDGYRTECKSCVKKHQMLNSDKYKEYRASKADKMKEYNKQYRASHKEYFKAQKKKHYEDNKADYLERVRVWRNNKRMTDPKFRLDDNMSNAIGSVIHKNGKSWRYYINFTDEDLYKHLESLFIDGMTWDNYGLWHVDHIIPVSWFEYEDADDERFKQAWALDNLQPLWAKDNLSKGNRFAGKDKGRVEIIWH